MDKTRITSLPIFKPIGNIRFYRHFDVLGGHKNTYTGNMYNDYVDIGLKGLINRSSITKCANHFFEIMTDSNYYKSEVMPIFVQYEQEGDEFVPYCYHKIENGSCAYCKTKIE